MHINFLHSALSIRYYPFFIVLLWLFFFQACDKGEEVRPVDVKEKEPVVITKPGFDTLAISYLALGDSYTIGEGVSVEERYPRQLADSLQYRGFKVADLRIVAATGWTTHDLSLSLDNAGMADGDYNLVSLLIGVNNQFRGYSLEEYRMEFTDLLDRAVAYGGGNKDRVFVLSIPDYSVTPFGQIYGNPQRTAEEIDQFNAANREITEDRGVRYFDITPISREARTDRSLIASDGLHPSGKMYTRWVEVVLPELLKLLER